MQKKAIVYLVPFSHLDLFWAGNREECLSRGAEIILTALRLLDKYPDYHFMIEAVNFLDYFCSAYPEQLPALKRFVTEQRLEVCPARSIIYTQLPSGETLVRNYLYGREACERWFGFSGKTATLSDIPGITPQMPQITAKSGFSGLFLSHGCPPHTDRILYVAPDGTEQRAYAPIHYGRCRRLFDDAKDYSTMCDGEEQIEAELGGMDYPQLCQFGTDLYIVTESAVENFHRWNAEGHRPFLFTTPGKYFEQNFPADPKRVSGELPSLWPNVESSWPDLWPQDLQAENAMFLAEFFGALKPERHPAELLKQAWLWLLDSMDHNQGGIGGEPADTEKRGLKQTARMTAERIARETALLLAAAAPSPRPDCFPIVIFNRLSWRRQELVRARTTLYGRCLAKLETLHDNNFRLVDDSGAPVPFRLIRHLQRVADSVEVEFTADVPAFSSRSYFLEAAEPERFEIPFRYDDGEVRDRSQPNTEAGSNILENQFFRLEIDRITGSVSLFDRQKERWLFLNAAMIGREEKRGDYVCNMPLSGRIMPATVRTIQLEESSPVVSRIAIRGTVYGMEYEQRLTLPAELPELEIENTIHWKCGNYVRIEQTFPFPDKTEYPVEYGVPFGKVCYPATIYDSGLRFQDIVTPERGNAPDLQIERIRLVSQWVAFGTNDSAVTIGCDHRMWEFDRHEIRNCMVRGIGYASGGVEILSDGTRRPQRRPPDGDYTSRYRIRAGFSPQCGWELNAPLYPVGVGRCIPGRAGDTPPPITTALPDTTGTGVIGCNVKPAERIPGAIVVRLFETLGIPAELRLPDGAWFETDLLENDPSPVGSPLKISPFEIKTLILKRDATAKTPAKDFAAIPKKDAFRNFECGCLQSNHRKTAECGLFGAPERQGASFGSRVKRKDSPQ